MKRFYKDVRVEPAAGGFSVLLDGKPVITPGRQSLLLPTRAMADAIAEEWRVQGDTIVPVSMPLLRLANTALDGVTQNRGDVIAAILRFGEHDLLCYRAEEPKLAARQQQAWHPLLAWAASRHGARLQTGQGVGHIPQSLETMNHLRAAIAAHDDFALAALHVLASITGSLVLALAVSDGEIDSARAFEISRLDEEHQAERWGRDAEAMARATRLAAEMDVAAAFLAAARD